MGTILKQTNYEAAFNNPRYQFTITNADQSVNVTGAIQNELSIAGQNQFDTAGQVLGDIPVVGALINMKEKFSNVIKLSGQSNVTSWESQLVWNGSDKPQFTVEYKFYNRSSQISETDKGALQMAKALQSTVLPNKGVKPSGMRKGFLYSAPLGYKLGAKGASGLLALKIGNWFQAKGLVATSTNFTPSIQVMRSGLPLFVTGSITLEPYRMITYDEFLGYFPQARGQ